MILIFKYHEILIHKRNKTYETFSFCIIYDSKTFDDKKKLSRWCRKHCEKKYNLNQYGCWFQTRDDAEAFEKKWADREIWAT